jgi:hypothetical protein
MLLRLLKARQYWREGSIGILALAVVVLVAAWIKGQNELETARLVYAYPQTKTVEKIVHVSGPVRIVTKVIEKPGETVTTIDENRGPVTETSEARLESQPVPISLTLAPTRTDRWLLAVQVDDGRFHQAEGYTGLVGYSFRNRVDVLGGWGGDGGKLQIGLRF